MHGNWIDCDPAPRILYRNRGRNQRLADALLEHGTLDADAVYELTASRIRPATLEEYGETWVLGGQG